MSKKNGKKSKAPLIIIIVIVLLAVGGVMLLKKNMENIAKSLTLPTEYTVVKDSIVRTVDGSGSLEAEDILEIKIPSGLRLEEISVEPGDLVSEGDTIATIDRDSITSLIVTTDNEIESLTESLKHTNDMTEFEIEELETRKSDLEGLREDLLVLYDDPVLVAGCDGVITEVGGNSESSYQSQSTDYSSIISSLMGVTVRTSSLKSENDTDVTDSSDQTDASDNTDATDSTDSTDPTEATEPTSVQPTVITDFTALNAIAAPVRGAAPVREIPENDYFAGEISWGVGADTFNGAAFDANTSYAAVILLMPKNGYAFSQTSLPVIAGAAQQVNAIEPNTGILTMIVVFPATEADPSAPATPTAEPSAPSQPSDMTMPTGVEDILGEDGMDLSSLLENSQISEIINQYIAQQVSAQAQSQLSGVDVSSLFGSAGSGIDYSGLASGLTSSAGSSRPSGTLTEDIVAKIAGTETVKISIYVDELDILSVHVGQEAAITLEATEDTYTGVISKVSNLSSQSSGNASYLIDISIPMADTMRFGMTAMATIVVSDMSDVLVIPMEALQQRGDQLFVYGGYDPATGALTEEIDVVTGITDGTNVEIVSGLNEGDSVYYMVANDLANMLGLY